MRIYRLPTYIVIVLMTCMLSACAFGPNVIGRWQQVDGEDTLEFREDGTFTTVDNMGATAVGRYTLHADGTLYYAVTHTDIQKAELRPVDTFAIRIAGVRLRPFGNELVLSTEDSAQVEIYRRAEWF